MPLSVEMPIRNAEIYSFKELKAGKVYVLNGNQGEQLVVKNEYTGVGGTAPIKPSNTVMKVVDPRVKMKVLENDEVGALRSYAQDSRPPWRACAEPQDAAPTSMSTKQSVPFGALSPNRARASG
jgi:hypothetical protein